MAVAAVSRLRCCKWTDSCTSRRRITLGPSNARDGRVLWHYYWKTKGGTHIGNRGLGMWGKWLYMETPDDYLVCLDAQTGKERWHKPIADFNRQYFSTMAPIVIGNHVIIGTGNDLDAPGFVQARDPETGDIQWTFFTTPQNKGDAGIETWGTLEGAARGGERVDSRILRSGDQAIHFRHRQSVALLYES